MKYLLQHDDLKRLISEGRNYSEIGKLYGISRQAVSMLVFRWGLREYKERVMDKYRRGAIM